MPLAVSLVFSGPTSELGQQVFFNEDLVPLRRHFINANFRFSQSPGQRVFKWSSRTQTSLNRERTFLMWAGAPISVGRPGTEGSHCHSIASEEAASYDLFGKDLLFLVPRPCPKETNIWYLSEFQ